MAFKHARSECVWNGTPLARCYGNRDKASRAESGTEKRYCSNNWHLYILYIYINVIYWRKGLRLTVRLIWLPAVSIFIVVVWARSRQKTKVNIRKQTLRSNVNLFHYSENNGTVITIICTRGLVLQSKNKKAIKKIPQNEWCHLKVL